MLHSRVMEHVVLITYSLILGTGFAALVGLMVLYRRTNSMFTKRMMIVQTIFIMNLAFIFLYYYGRQIVGIIGPEPEGQEVLLGTVATLLNILLFLSIGWLLASDELAVLKNRWTVASDIGVIVLPSLLILRMIAPKLTLFQTLFWRLSMFLLVALFFLTIGLTLITSKKVKSHPTTVLLMKGIGWCAILYAPLGIAEFIISYLTDGYLQPLSLEYLFYLGINVVVIYVMLRPSVKEKVPCTNISHFRLTKRELEMAELIAQGMSNKEIATTLGISLATVRTHIYNLYQKVGARSRVELLNIVKH